ncbi:hypothetical protein MKX01_006016 [Papaver californicum]|nr:hypothetical protein MKX01_006016 [Papaver californicum]
MEASRMMMLSQPLPLLRHQCRDNPIRFRRGIQNVRLKVVMVGLKFPLSKNRIPRNVILFPLSKHDVKTRGCGLPPGGSIGALEGVSYLATVGMVGWSLYTKSKSGSGLPNGPFGLLGAVEGLSYLALLAVLVVFGLLFLDQGFIPGPVFVPGDKCFG